MDLLTPRQRREFERYLKSEKTDENERRYLKLSSISMIFSILSPLIVFLVMILPGVLRLILILLVIAFFISMIIAQFRASESISAPKGTEYSQFRRGTYCIGTTTLANQAYAYAQNGRFYLRDSQGTLYICPFEEDFRLAYAGEKMVTVTIGETRYILRGKTPAGPDAPQPPLSQMMNAAAQPVPVPMGAPYGMPEPVPVPMPAAPDFALNTMVEDDSQEPF